VVSARWLETHVEAARQVFAPYGIRIEAKTEPFSPTRCALLDRPQRDALAAYAGASDRVVVLVVQRIRDLDVPTYDLMGVHWRYGGAERRWRGRHWVYLTARARPPTLAHELAHYFGLPHDPAGGNLMTPGPSDRAWRRREKKPRPFQPRLSPAQARKLRRALGALAQPTSAPHE
jgi:hypothetical protein